jgi:nicotinamidase-related amidase
MPELPKFDRASTAVLAMDCQKAIVGFYVKDQQGFLERSAGILNMARSAGIMVIHIKVGFRPGLPEIGTRNTLFAALKSSPQHQETFMTEKGDIHPALGPKEGDIVVTKHRVSAFAGTDLDQILRANEIETLVLFGIATSGVVLSTLVEASDQDYRVVVVKDCCVDQDEVLHAALVDRYFPKRGTVVTAAEIAGAIGA